MFVYDSDRAIHEEHKTRIFICLYGNGGVKEWKIADADDAVMAAMIFQEYISDFAAENNLDQIARFMFDITDHFDKWVKTGKFPQDISSKIVSKWFLLNETCREMHFLYPSLFRTNA